MIDYSELIKQALPYLHTIFLSVFGGTVQYFRQTKDNNKKFRWSEFFTDILASAFAGTLTYFLCKIADLDDYHAMVLVAISGHMGVKAIDLIEHIYNKFLPKI